MKNSIYQEILLHDALKQKSYYFGGSSRNVIKTFKIPFYSAKFCNFRTKNEILLNQHIESPNLYKENLRAKKSNNHSLFITLSLAVLWRNTSLFLSNHKHQHHQVMTIDRVYIDGQCNLIIESVKNIKS